MSYFNSCSNGGRQGLTEAVMYPADYDGLLVGAPFITPNLTDLTAFARRGGKIVIYHGANDAPQLTVNYYNKLIETLGRAWTRPTASSPRSSDGSRMESLPAASPR